LLEPILNAQFFLETLRKGSEVAAVIQSHPWSRSLSRRRSFPCWAPLLLAALLAGCGQPSGPPVPRRPAAVAAEKQQPPPNDAVEQLVAPAVANEDGANQAQAEKVAPVGSVAEKDLLGAAGNTGNWLMYGRTYDAQRHSPLNQVNKKNVNRLIPVWTFQTGVLDGFECTPLIIDGIMYITTPWNHAYAIDCKTGSQIWHYEKSLPQNLALCCDAVNRGFAAWGENLYMTTLDAHLVCLDRNTGKEIWDTEVTISDEAGKEIKEIYKLAYSATVAPLVVKDKVIMGISGAEYGIRGFIDAYDLKTGKRVWRFYTIPSPNDKAEHYQKALKTWEGKSWITGGGSTWVTGTYDPKLNTLYWGVGNPSPDFNGDVRKGDNLYTVSILALNPDDGTYKWHFQNSPHDVWDYDGVNEPMLIDMERDGKPLKALVQAHRNGYFYCLNRENGAFIYGKPFCEVNWTDRKQGVDGLDPKTGRPFVNPAALPTEKGVRVCPGAAGGKEWNPMAYHPGTGFCYVPVINNCAKFTSGKAFFIKGQPYWGSSLTLIDNQASGSLKAIDVKTGAIKWDVATRSPMVAGVLTTGGGLVFTGDAEGFFTAYDADNGKVLWSFQCGSGHHASPITYTLDGRQYIAVAVGWGGWTAGFAGDGAPWLRNARRGNTVFVFALPKEN
jgi:alcohol dehydrogenase (cytochrome c)